MWRFNSNICKLAKLNFKKILNDGKNLKVGSKGLDQIKRIWQVYYQKI